MQPTAYQYVKLGANLEFLRGVCTVSIMQTTSLAAFPNLMDNLPTRRFSVVRVLEAVTAVLIQLEEMKLEQSLRIAEAFRPMVKDMEDYLRHAQKPQLARLNDPFAEQLVALAKQVALAVRNELGSAEPASGSKFPQGPAT
jgi:hypothetical protein